MIRRADAGGRQGRGGSTTSGVRRIGRWASRLVGLFVVVLLVVGIGVGMTPSEPQVPVYSAAEQVQLDAEGRYRALAADAREAAAADPALAPALVAVADDLSAQAAAVALPRSPAAPESSPASPSPETSATDPAPPAPAPAPVDGRQVFDLLRDSALRSLRDAVEAEPGPARVLAAAGANQWRHTVLLGAALGIDTGLPSADALPAGDLAGGTGLFAGSASSGPDSTPPAAVLAAGPGAGDGAVPGDCAGTPRGSEADRKALLGAKLAEDRARFGYEVAAALLPDPPALLARSTVHRAAADAAARRLADLCTPVTPAPAGFAIGPAFRTDPALALRELEQDHAALYADLIPAVGPDTRPWAVAAFNAAAQRSLDAGTGLGTFPALEDGAAGSTTPSGAAGQEEPADG
ncbi:DUF4439 domain-containing protein [Arthrobacter agilis]|uniref:DUF4439 domain-containing protein n=1 Tax=Arthrobacter agilis TaxID=37921 RepID=UPI002782908E|nr:DUF4439 domain-containing protein [Arthrobacter agilis]MDQ0734215.1 hypothetical protein [Arthrobacter agilis]